MRVVIAGDLSVTLADRDDFKTFDLAIAADCPRSAVAEAAAEIATFDGSDQAWIDPAWLMAQDDDPAWRVGCAAMIEKVRPFGWVRDDGAVRAHVVTA